MASSQIDSVYRITQSTKRTHVNAKIVDETYCTCWSG